MAYPTLSPLPVTSSIVLPSSSTASEVSGLPLLIYSADSYFLSGAAEQVGYVYRRLGGSVLDIELTKNDVWAAYQDACLEYSMLINMHQSKNVIYQLLGATTGSFDSNGQIVSGSALSGANIALKFPKFSYKAARLMGQAASTENGMGGTVPIYSASFATIENVQDYDLQAIISSSAALTSSLDFYNKVGNKRINITKVFYRTPHAYWRFFAFYGGINLYGNNSSYGQFQDDSTFEVVPVWQNKLQASTFHDSLQVRTSHYSYEIKNNKIRIYPVPQAGYNPERMWFNFFVDDDPWTESGSVDSGVNGINNMNTLPFENIPYQNINSIGKQWIRRFALESCKETLGYNRSKFTTIPIPGDSVTLNGPDLVSKAIEMKDKLREELKKILDDMVYSKLAEDQAKRLEENAKILSNVPTKIYIG